VHSVDASRSILSLFPKRKFEIDLDLSHSIHLSTTFGRHLIKIQILDFFIFLGPQPEQVIEQYTWLVGRSFLPPYWSLGFQLCRWDYSNITWMKTVHQRNRDAGVPIDVQYADIDYMDAEKVFTVDPIHYQGLKEYFQELNADGVRTIIILDPGMIDDQVSYQPTIQGIDEDVFIRGDDGELMRGAVWPGPVFFPDFFTQRTQKWWSRWIHDFYKVNLTFDGLWIDMNEPALFETNDPIPWNWMETGSNYTLKCPISAWDDPPYRTKSAFRWDHKANRTSRLSDRTMCMAARQGEFIDATSNKTAYRHYDVHRYSMLPSSSSENNLPNRSLVCTGGAKRNQRSMH
jgi:alpha-glucosidase (family GH31 glycosyl hydrolase)